MSVVLNGITLNPNMLWPNRNQYAPIRQEARVTLGGTVVHRSGTLSNGRPIDLVAILDQGWLVKAQVDAVTLIAQTAGTSYTLTIGAESFEVLFRHEDAPAVDLQALIPRAVPLDGDYFIGTIKLITV